MDISRSEAFEELAGVAGGIMNGSVEAWKSNGGKVVGYFCSHVPTEIFMAAGVNISVGTCEQK